MKIVKEFMLAVAVMYSFYLRSGVNYPHHKKPHIIRLTQQSNSGKLNPSAWKLA